VIALGLLVVACVLVGIQSRHHDELAQPGETAQLDYVLALPHVPATGDTVSDSALPPGGSADSLPEGPYSYAGSTPPAYYVATAVVARPMAANTGWSVLDVARWTGVLWMWLFLLTTFRLARLVGASRGTAAGAATFVAASTSLSTFAAYVGPDVAGAAVGGLVLIAAWQYDGTKRALLVLAGACALAGFTKLTLAASVAAAALAIVLRPLLERRRAGGLAVGPAVLGAAVAAVAFVLPAGGWILRTRAAAEVSAHTLNVYAPFVADHVDWSAYRDTLLYPWLNPVGPMWASPLLTDPTDAVVGLVLLAMLSIGTLSAALTFGRPRLAALGTGLLVTTLVGPAAYLELDVLLNGLAMPIEPRHALGLLPGTTACACWLLRDRGGAVAMVIACAWALFNLLT
jgi:hypothetical protein